MDGERFPMAPSQEPNPLRPYYIPPSIGVTHAAAPSSTPRPANVSSARPPPTFASPARDYLPELDLDLKTTTTEAWQYTRSLFDTIAWRYTSVLLAQPFDVSKTILQVSAAPSSTTISGSENRLPKYNGVSGRRRTYNGEEETDEGDETDQSDDIPDYFTATAPRTRSRSPRRRKRTPPDEDASPSPTPRPRNRREHFAGDEFKIRLQKSEGIMQAISALYSTSGAVGCWRATNTTFLYAILLRTTDSFIRSLILAVLGLPEIVGPEQGGLAPGLSVAGGVGFSGITLSDSPNPLGSLMVVGLSSCLTALLLAPLDLVRTRLIVTPISTSPRGLVQNLRALPSLVVPTDLWLPTALYHTVPNLFSAAAPLFLRRQLGITAELTPSLWSVASFTSTLTELFIRLPLETVLRRAQVSSMTRSEPKTPLIVDPGPYLGVWGTVYSILYVEGERTTKKANGMLRTSRGQGVAGLVRGWRVGFWGLVGVWGAGALGSGEVKHRGEF